jgi:hypothetical protein
MKRYTPATMADVRRALEGLPGEMKVGIGPGVRLDAKTVAQLRAVPVWPKGSVLELPRLVDRESMVMVERVEI